MSWENYSDVLQQLRDAGLDVMDIEVDTRVSVRCREIGGDREKRGWYWLHSIELTRAGQDGVMQRSSYIVGSYGIFRGTDPGKRKIRLEKSAVLSEDEKRAIATRHAESARLTKLKREAEAEKASAKAMRAWLQYLPNGSSRYLETKGVGAHGIRFSPTGSGTLAIPMCDRNGRIHGLQIIRDRLAQGRRQKEYWPKGITKRGHFHLIGLPRDVVLIAEGYATAATLHEATGLPVAVAFDAGNLLPVAEALHKAYLTTRILICADDDYLTKDRDGNPINPGIVAAEAAAHAVNGAVAVPQFPFDREGKKLTDYNDLAQHPLGGTHLVGAQISTALDAAGFVPKMRLQAAVSDIGGGEERDGEFKRRTAVSILPLDQAVHRFVPIDDGTGKYLFDTWQNRMVSREQMTAILPAGIRGDDIKRHPVWIERGAYYVDEVGFDPSGNDASVRLNTWTGWPMKPKQGGCQVLLDLLFYLCNHETQRGDEVYQWLLRWMAWPLQHPGGKMASAVIMHGPQGTGKSAIWQTYAKIYGKYATVLNQRGLEDRFNSDWADSKLFILAEEVVTRAEMWHIKNELKELVTGDKIRINPKNMPAYTQRNQVNIVYLSNESQPLPIENDDRRHLVIWTPEKLQETLYDDLWEEIENGGAEALYYYLLNLDMGDFHPKKRPPMTEAKKELINLSMPSEERFLEEWKVGETVYPFGPCTNKQLYTAYQRWCRESGVRNPRESNAFIGRILRLPGWSCSPRHFYTSTMYLDDTKVQQRVVMPPDSLLQASNVARPRDKTLAQWITDHYIKFFNALGKQSGLAYED